MKRSWLSVGILLSLVHQGVAQNSNDQDESLSLESLESTDSIQLINWLKTQSIKNSGYVQNGIIYSWTSAAQINEIEDGGPLFSRSKASDGSISYFDSILKKVPVNNGYQWAPMDREEFQNKRFGWSNLWATSMGYQGEKYGDKLIRIKLKPDAVFAKVTTQFGRTQISYYDLELKYISRNDLIDNPERLAGVFFTHVDIENETKAEKTHRYKRQGTMMRARKRGFKLSKVTYQEHVESPAYRELILFNEKAIESIETDQSKLSEDIQRAIDGIGLVKKYVSKYQGELEGELSKKVKYPYHRFKKVVKYGTYSQSFEYLTADLFNSRRLNTFHGLYADEPGEQESMYKTILNEYIKSLCFTDKSYELNTLALDKMIQELKKRQVK